MTARAIKIRKLVAVYVLSLGLLSAWPSPAEAFECPFPGQDGWAYCLSWCDFQAGSCQQGCHNLPDPERTACYDECYSDMLECYDYCWTECT
jgi:hypothetical protein